MPTAVFAPTTSHTEHLAWANNGIAGFMTKEQLAAATMQVLTQGGDARIALTDSGANPYGCKPFPDGDLVAFGSSTASVISQSAFQAACNLHMRALTNPGIIRPELERQRLEIRQLTGAAQVPGCEVILAASGTDVHLIATLLATEDEQTPLQTVMVQPTETGSGVPAAISAQHFAARTCQGDIVDKGTSAMKLAVRKPYTVNLRNSNGTLRTAKAVDAEFSSQVNAILRDGGNCLLVLTDQSKTGLMAPGPACAVRLKAQHGDKLTVLVDACQFRLSADGVASYLTQGFMVAITGSKFVGGPAFSGALLLPPQHIGKARIRGLHALKNYSSKCDWPANWKTASALADVANIGLLLRWEAALTELRKFRSVPAPVIHSFLQEWGLAVAQRIAADPAFEALPVRALRRFPSINIASKKVRHGELEASWDELQTIFPFVIYKVSEDGKRRPITTEETARIYRQLGEIGTVNCNGDVVANTRFQLGQPVACGERHGIPISALRLCASARMFSTLVGTAHDESGATVAAALRLSIRQAMLAFDKIVLLLHPIAP
jgi:hypothetical protein